MKKVRKIAVCVTDFIYITHNTHPVPLTSGFRGSPGPPPLGNACGIVPVHHYSHLISQQVWRFFCLFFTYDPVVHRGDTERILAQWLHPVTSNKALDPLHRLYRHISATVKWVKLEVHSFFISNFFINLTIANYHIIVI